MLSDVDFETSNSNSEVSKSKGAVYHNVLYYQQLSFPLLVTGFMLNIILSRSIVSTAFFLPTNFRTTSQSGERRGGGQSVQGQNFFSVVELSEKRMMSS